MTPAYENTTLADSISNSDANVNRKNSLSAEGEQIAPAGNYNVYGKDVALEGDDIVIATTNWSRDVGLTHPRKDNFVDFDHGTTLIVSDDRKYSAEVVVGITDSGEAVLYDVVNMTPTEFEIKKAESSTAATTQNAIGDILEDSATDSIPQKKDAVNREYSLSAEGETPSWRGTRGSDVRLEGASEDIAPPVPNEAS